MARGGKFNLAHWFIYGEVDWEQLNGQIRSVAPFLSGALFGAGWAFWADALVYSGEHGEKFPFTYHIPGIVATIALVMMNLVSRDDLANMGDMYGSGDEGSESRAKIWLFLSYCIAFGSVAGSVAVLITCVQNQSHVPVGVGGLVQCGLILLAGLLLWGFRTSDEGYGLIQ